MVEACIYRLITIVPNWKSQYCFLALINSQSLHTSSSKVKSTISLDIIIHCMATYVTDVSVQGCMQLHSDLLANSIAHILLCEVTLISSALCVVGTPMVAMGLSLLMVNSDSTY